MDSSGDNLFVTDMRTTTHGVFWFTRPNGYFTWSEAQFFPTSQFVDTNSSSPATPSDQFGASIVASSDGNGFFVGDPGLSAMFPISYSTTTDDWTTWPTLVAPLQVTPPSNGGTNMSISASGTMSRVFMGGAGDDGGIGAVWMA
jgi:hypothetical protein